MNRCQVTQLVVVKKSLECELHEGIEITLFTGVSPSLAQSWHVARVCSQEIFVECWINELAEVEFEP